MKVLGWDIGGAHLKAALCVGGRITRAWLTPCPLWRDLAALRDAMQDMVREAGAVDLHSLTMTGELADIFPDRDTGVRHLLDTASALLPVAALRIYAHPARFLSVTGARRATLQVASANWSASAAWLARTLGHGLLVDVGSTTTDLIPLSQGRVVARGLTDAQRLACEELVYSGVARTPVMAMAERVPLQGQWLAPMAEVFATAADVYRVLGCLPEGADLLPSADGRGKTRIDSARRLGRMFGIDAREVGDLRDCAHFLAQAQLWRLQCAAMRVLSAIDVPARAPVVGAGVGRFLARELAQRLGRPYGDMERYLPARPAVRALAADCAPAACVALLASQGHG